MLLAQCLDVEEEEDEGTLEVKDFWFESGRLIPKSIDEHNRHKLCKTKSKTYYPWH